MGLREPRTGARILFSQIHLNVSVSKATTPARLAPIAAMLVLAVNTKRSGFKRGPLKMAIESAPAWLAWSLVALMR